MSNKAQRGLTLIELLVFIVIIGIAANAMLAVFANLTRASAGLLPDKQAQAIANSLMQEIMAQPFASVLGYNGLNTNGNVLSGLTSLAGYSVNVAVTASPGPMVGVPANKILRVSVSVTSPSSVTARLDQVKFNY